MSKSNLCKLLHFRIQTRPVSSQKNEIKDEVEYDDGPIKFSTSRAVTYKAKDTITGLREERLWYEPYVLMFSIGVFLVYFCILREENDVDKELDKSLYSRIEGLEEYQLKLSLQYNLDNGLATADITKRLAEIEREKANAAASTEE